MIIRNLIFLGVEHFPSLWLIFFWSGKSSMSGISECVPNAGLS